MSAWIVNQNLDLFSDLLASGQKCIVQKIHDLLETETLDRSQIDRLHVALMLQQQASYALLGETVLDAQSEKPQDTPSHISARNDLTALNFCLSSITDRARRSSFLTRRDYYSLTVAHLQLICRDKSQPENLLAACDGILEELKMFKLNVEGHGDLPEDVVTSLSTMRDSLSLFLPSSQTSPLPQSPSV